MKLLFATMFTLSAAALAQAQPRITTGGVVNSASYAAAALPSGAIAQGSLFVVFGSGLGPAALQQITAFPLSNTFGGTSMTVTVNGTSTKPLIVYTSAGQLAAIMPSATPVGTGTLTVTYNSATSATQAVTVVPSSFGIYSVNQGGTGAGIITNTNYQTVGFNSSANPGEAYIIWGTGLGPVTGDESAGGTAVKIGTIPVEVLVGSKQASVIGYARANCCAGLDQIAFTVPSGVTGCSVPVAVKIGNVVSNYVSLSIAASGRTCSDPSGITPITVTQNGTVSIGEVDLTRTNFTISAPAPIGNVTSTTDSGSAAFFRYNYAQYASTQSPLQLSTIGSCTVFNFTGTTAVPPAVASPIALDAGAAISVNGPNGLKTLVKTADQNGYYSATLGGGIVIPGLPSTSAPLYLLKGAYKIDNGAGGADVGAFSTTLNVFDPLNWTNAASVTTVPRASGQLVTWTGGDPGGNVYIVGFSTAGTTDANTVGAEFICVERTSAGQFTVPAAVLLSLPATNTTEITGAAAMILESVTTAPFTAKGLDQGIVSSSSATFQTVTFQ